MRLARTLPPREGVRHAAPQSVAAALAHADGPGLSSVSLSLYTYICIHIYIYISYVYIYTHKCVCIYIYIYICKYTQVLFTYTHMRRVTAPTRSRCARSESDMRNLPMSYMRNIPKVI